MTRTTGSHRRRNGEGPWVETHGPSLRSTSPLQTGSLSRTGEEVQGLEEVRGGAEEICQEGQIDHGASPIRRCTSVVSVTSATGIPLLPHSVASAAWGARSTRGEGYCGDCPVSRVGEVPRVLRHDRVSRDFPTGARGAPCSRRRVRRSPLASPSPRTCAVRNRTSPRSRRPIPPHR